MVKNANFKLKMKKNRLYNSLNLLKFLKNICFVLKKFLTIRKKCGILEALLID